MGYNKVIKYANFVEVYQYEEDIRPVRRKSRKSKDTSRLNVLADDREDSVLRSEQITPKRPDNARHASLGFRRLVSANLEKSDYPVLASFTYAENVTEIERGRKDFSTFGRNARHRFGDNFKWICVPEFQKRGAIHFHALLWGLPFGVVAEERHTRLVAGLWKKGFVDLVQTDGNEKLSGYLSKYMSKTFLDVRLKGKKAYSTSHNVKRPVIEKNAIMLPYYVNSQFGIELPEYPELSTAQLLREKTYDTKMLGKGTYRKYLITK